MRKAAKETDIDLKAVAQRLGDDLAELSNFCCREAASNGSHSKLLLCCRKALLHITAHLNSQMRALFVLYLYC